MLTKIKLIGVIAILLLLLKPEFRFIPYTGADIVQDGSGSRGSSWGDIDGDGDLDLFVANRQDQNNLLYINKTVDPSQPILELVQNGDIVNDGGDSQGSSFGDFDNDGDLDLYVANRHNQKNFLYRNQGAGVFEKITIGEIVNDKYSSTSISWVDVNNNGYLDLFAANRNDEPNSLYINNGSGGFEKLKSGAIVEDQEDTRACVWSDFDNDGDQDLLAGNAKQLNSIYINNGNLNFTKLNEVAPLMEKDYTYGVSAQDVNNDGFLDLFVANLYEPNVLLINNGDATFTKTTEGDIVNDKGHSKGLVWQDFDNDGDLDLFVSNGTPGSVEDHFFYRNDENGGFHKITDAKITKHGGLAGGSSSADVNGDGQMDLLVTNWVDNANNKLFFNLSNTEKNNWIQIQLKGTKSPSTPYGAIATLYYPFNGESKSFVQHLASQSGYASQSSQILHFGINKATGIDSLVVKWPSGIKQIVLDLKVNQKHTITEAV